MYHICAVHFHTVYDSITSTYHGNRTYGPETPNVQLTMNSCRVIWKNIVKLIYITFNAMVRARAC